MKKRRSSPGRGEAAVRRLVSEFESSGLNRRAFSQAVGVPVSTLDYYRRRARHEGGGPPLVELDFTAGLRHWGEVPHEGGLVETEPPLGLVMRNGRRIELRGGLSWATANAGPLGELIRVLEEA